MAARADGIGLGGRPKGAGTMARAAIERGGGAAVGK